MKKLLFIYNPRSGKGAIKDKLSDIMDVFVKKGFDVTVHTTQGHGDATQKAFEAANNYDRIVCGGGDGTLNEVTKGIMRAKSEVSLGYIPTGSTNDFGSSIGLPIDIMKAAHIAAGDIERKIDIGKFNDDYFVYVAAFGIFTQVSYNTDQNLKNFLGHAAYILEAIKSLQDIPSIPLQIEADGHIIRGDFIFGMITNALQVGGVKDFVKGDVRLSDGVFEAMFIRTPKNPIELAEIGTFLTNVRRDTNLVHTFQAKTIKLQSNKKVAWTLDGEFGGNESTVLVDCIHNPVSMTVSNAQERIVGSKNRISI